MRRLFLSLVLFFCCSSIMAGERPVVMDPYTEGEFSWYDGEDLATVAMHAAECMDQLTIAETELAMAWSAWMVDPYDDIVYANLDAWVWQVGFLEQQIAIADWWIYEWYEDHSE